jgi:uncharacterized delta-60 repeat protein
MMRGGRGRRRGTSSVLAAAVLLGLAGLALAAPGDLDPGFGADGRVTIDYGGADRADDVLVQPDGKVVTAGGRGEGMVGTAQVSRLNGGGTLDAGFGNVTIDFARAPDRAFAVARQPDGRLVVAGTTQDNVAVARLLPDGQLDPSFAPGASGDDLDGADGRLEVSYGGSPDAGIDAARDVLVQPDGTIVTAGSAVLDSGFAVVTQLSPSGAITGFGNVFIGFNGGAGARAVARQSDGKIVVAGITSGANGSDIAVARILPATGQLDPAFSPGGADGDGRLVLDLGGSEVAEDALVQPDGGIVLAGRQQIASQDILVVRLTADGARDPGFDGDGVSRINLAETESGNAVVLQPDGKIVVAGSVGNDHAVARLQPGGSPDTTFDGDGVRTFGFPGASTGAASGVGLAADGSVVTAGGVVLAAGGEDAAVARLRGDAAPGAGPGGGPGGAGAAGRPPRCGGKRATIVGTPRRDRLRGTGRADVIAALGGDDAVSALGGGDIVCGGPGRDLLRGGPGNDRLLGQAGNDRLLGGPGVDQLQGQAGRDALVGGPGLRDRCLGGPGRDRAACERGGA